MSEPIELGSLGPDELLALVNKLGGQRAFCRKYDTPRRTLQRALAKGRAELFRHRPAPPVAVEAVMTGVRRFILTSAQDGTKVNEPFLQNLEAYRDWLSIEGPCEIIIAGFTYNKSLFEEHRKNKVFFPARITPYLRHERIRLGDRIDFCGEMNTLPTAESPLSGFETYTRHRWGIFPHVKVQLKSIPTMKNEPAKVIMTTGAVTLPNYVQKRAGIKASFHHVIGAVLVEIAADGKFFARHLLGDDDGSFYDLDRHVTTMGVTEGNRVTAINWGDIHVAQIDPEVSQACFGIAPSRTKSVSGGRLWEASGRPTVLDTLRPEFQFFHDSFDGKARNSHNLKDPHQMFQLFVDGSESVEDEGREVAMFFSKTRRNWCESVVVASNHDTQIDRWLKVADAYATDPINAVFFLKCQLAKYEAMEARNKSFSIFQHLMKHAFSPYDCTGVRFLQEDESFVVNRIECGMHGHLGANGARGSPNQFRKMGPKANTGHTHSAGIIDGIYTAGVTGNLDMGYNSGLSSWSHSHIVTLPNGKRQIITMIGGEWRL